MNFEAILEGTSQNRGTEYECRRNHDCGVRGIHRNSGDQERGVISDLAFGGKNLGWLYVAECGRLFRRSPVTGAAVGSPYQPPKPPLGGREI